MQHTNSRTYVCQCIWCCALTATWQSEIVACCVTSLETENGMTAMANAFKKHNSRWDKVAVVMTDKDMTERTVFGSAFPNATMHLCLFHVLRSFRRQITERDLVLDMMSRLTYARSIHDYTTTYTELLECGLESVIRYFNRTGICPRMSGWKAWKARSSPWVKQPTTTWKARTRR